MGARVFMTTGSAQAWPPKSPCNPEDRGPWPLISAGLPAGRGGAAGLGEMRGHKGTPVQEVTGATQLGRAWDVPVATDPGTVQVGSNAGITEPGRLPGPTQDQLVRGGARPRAPGRQHSRKARGR